MFFTHRNTAGITDDKSITNCNSCFKYNRFSYGNKFCKSICSIITENVHGIQVVGGFMKTDLECLKEIFFNRFTKKGLQALTFLTGTHVKLDFAKLIETRHSNYRFLGNKSLLRWWMFYWKKAIFFQRKMNYIHTGI